MCASAALPSGQTELAEQQFTIVELCVGAHETIAGHTIAIIRLAAVVIRLTGRMYETNGAAVRQLRADELLLVRFLIQNDRYGLCLQMGAERRRSGRIQLAAGVFQAFGTRVADVLQKLLIERAEINTRKRGESG